MHKMIFVIGLSLGVWATAIGLTILGTYLTLKHFKNPPPHLDQAFALYPVSILKPMSGADPGLKENLKSFFELDYPQYELIFSVESKQDPCVGVIENLMAR